MIKAFLLTLLLTFAVLGIAELINGIKLRLIRPKEQATTYTLLFLKTGFAVEQLKFLLAKFEWNGEIFTNRIIACFDVLNEEERQECLKLSDVYNIVFCKRSDLAQLIQLIK
ncbi:MAG: hypothetical protein II802_01635 [Clostridia bacterium]|nr:hypothetical protein [Clostridia bacterium]